MDADKQNEKTCRKPHRKPPHNQLYRYAAAIYRPFYPTCIAKPDQCGAVYLQGAGNGSIGIPAVQQAPDHILFVRELGMLPQSALWAAQMDALSLLPGQGLLGPLGDQIALDLGGQAKCKGQHFALDVIAQPEVILDGPHPALFLHRLRIKSRSSFPGQIPG